MPVPVHYLSISWEKRFLPRAGVRQFFGENPVLRGDFYDNLPSCRKRWEDYEKIVTTIFEGISPAPQAMGRL